MEENAGTGLCIVLDQVIEEQVFVRLEDLHTLDSEAEATAELLLLAVVQEVADALVAVRALVDTLVVCTLTHNELLSECVRRELSATASSVLTWERATRDETEATLAELVEAAAKEGTQVVVERESDAVVLKMIVSIEQLMEIIRELVVETLTASPTADSTAAPETETSVPQALVEDHTVELFECAAAILEELLKELTGEMCVPALADAFESAPLTPLNPVRAHQLPEHAFDELAVDDGEGVEILAAVIGELISEEAKRFSSTALCDALATQLIEMVIESLDE